tara:strand:+ start:7411 stop:8046 length:636 start_codon:yes stop_codon:yes gene_type:complete
MEKLIQDSYIESLKDNKNTFDILENHISDLNDKPCNNLYELRQKQNNKKQKGDLFEEFCKIYLTKINKYTNVWLLKEVPENILNNLCLKRLDMGIDLICQNKDDYYAFQVKFRKKSGKKRILSWNCVSTFYALCYNTGPWKECYVITNCDYVRHATKGKKQKSICLQTFRNISNDLWIKMYSDLKDTNNIIPEVNVDELRNLRLKRFLNNI